MTKRISILGSTGSIGKSALSVIASLKNGYRVAGLSSYRNISLLSQQARIFRPESVAVMDEVEFKRLSPRISARIFFGEEGLRRIATLPKCDLVISGVVGAVGLVPLLSALSAGKTVALANKESLIMAGSLVMETARKHGATLLPVDSEHSAMFQCLGREKISSVRKIILTASGGPFYGRKNGFHNITPREALQHPTWVMGKKITVDSATLMNKGLEAIEAHFLFGIPIEKIKIVIHRQSILHSAIEYEDGALLAQLSHPDMRLPIQYAITYPERKASSIRALNLAEIRRLDFDEPDFRKFPCLMLALEAGRMGGAAPCALSASNEVAVRAFLEGRIRFTDIPRIVENVLKKHGKISRPNLSDILETDRQSRARAMEMVC